MLAGKESALDYRKPVFKAMDYISHHLDDNPGLDEVAAAAAISTFHFHRIFKTMVGETIAGFTRRLRMERAARRLLASPQSDITTLALAAGFSSSQNFAKAFRLHFSMSPSEYRQQQGGNWKSKIGNAPLPFDTYDGLVMHPVTEHPGLLQGASVRLMPARRVAYMRRLGPYGKETCEQAHRDLLALFASDEAMTPAGTLSLYWDIPDITDETRCRTDVCIELGPEIPAGRQLTTQTIAAGPYAVCQFIARGDQLVACWETAFRWVVGQGLNCDDRPCYEQYHAGTDSDRDHYVFDICIPLINR
ncbi:AraC family transcriptional regulator [Aeromonas veronii]|uniref:AraC family transcriptional regulator n=1 Tax=Aeromonas veronii TaxID=654 RepID=UPI001FD6AEA4|nr:AraC family transcriptional regulator [Aeromonas veronii]MCJ8213127.1 AraC family transcriptional regulator [Aeromonas veronii]USP59456.1 AraC family transcriptional regulator [Aeromonas veronii]